MSGRVDRAPGAGGDHDSDNSDDDDDGDAAAVERAYRRFWRVAERVDHQPEEAWRTALGAVSAPPLLDELLDGFRAQRRRGVVSYGSVELRPTVVQVMSDRASVIDCQDASRSGEVEQDSGRVQRVGSARTPFAAVLRKDAAGVWRVSEARYLSEPC